ncbi:hypothetical protein [Lacticaseibacillus casei]|nr:hypothetical protein [Lacticaseibacillus casei]
MAEEDGQCIGGVFGYSTMYKIGFIETLLVAEAHRHKALEPNLLIRY